jgi:hypothetical protein
MTDARKKAEGIAEMAMENWRCGREYFPFNDDVKALSDLFQDLITAAIEAERKRLKVAEKWIRDLLLSADASWKGGHDWSEATKGAEAFLRGPTEFQKGEVRG